MLYYYYYYYLKWPPSARTHAVKRRCHWRIAPTVIEWSILVHSVWHFVYQQHNVTTMSSQSKSSSGVVVKFNCCVGNCQRNPCARSSKYQNIHIKVMTRKLLACFFFVDTVYVNGIFLAMKTLNKFLQQLCAKDDTKTGHWSLWVKQVATVVLLHGTLTNIKWFSNHVNLESLQ